jgi:F1F0 ATPase subunit 2
MDALAMTNSHFAGHGLLLCVLGVSAWFAIGAPIGAFYFVTLRWNVHMLIAGRSLPLALASQLVRFALIACLLAAVASRFGALPLLAATAGILAARMAVVQLGVRR